MWVGKIAIIMYIFSTAILFSGHMIDEAFGFNLFAADSYQQLEALVNKNTIDEQPSIDLIFGDFLAAGRVVFGIITGDTISGAFSSLPNFSDTWMLLVRIMFTLSSALLWAYVIASRSL